MDIYHFSSPKPPILGRCKLLNCNKVAAALAALSTPRLTPRSVDGDRLILARITRYRFGSLKERFRGQLLIKSMVG